MSTFSQIVQSSGQLTAPGTICVLPTTALGSSAQDVKRIIYWTVELDAELIATAALVVAIQTLNLAKGTYFAPTVPAWNAISLAVGSKQLFNYAGPLAGIQINVATFGTSTGTLYAHILGVS